MSRKPTLLLVAGGIWFAVGLWLLVKGSFLLLLIVELQDKAGPLVKGLSSLFNLKPHVTITVLMASGFFLGWIKARWLLARSVKRVIERLSSLEEPLKFSQLYRIRDYLLIAGMIAIGQLMRALHFPTDIRGLIDLVIGLALLSGSMVYFSLSIKMKNQSSL